MLRKSLRKNAFDVISIVKVHTIKWQIYPDEVFYAKDLLLTRVTILLPFLGNALSLLTGTATTKDVNSIKEHVNQLIEVQSTQEETLVHIVSILNATWYVAQVNKHSINILMDKVDETSHNVNNL